MMDSNTEERHQKVAAAMAHLYGADLIKAVDDAVALELSNHPVSHPALVKLLLDLRIEYVARETIVLACLKKDKDWDLDPSHGLFHHFRFKRLAEIFRQHVSIPQISTLVHPTDLSHSRIWWR